MNWSSIGGKQGAVVCALLFLCACAPAAVITEQHVLMEPGFAVEVPDDGQWILRKNRRWNGQSTLIYRYAERNVGALSFRLFPYPDVAHKVPLTVLAEAYFLTKGVSNSVDAEVAYTTEVLLDGQRAAVVYGTETIRPETRSVCQVMTLSPDGIVVIRLIAPQETFDYLTPELDRILRSFRFRYGSPIDPFLLDQVPMDDPDHDPDRFEF